MAWAEANLLTGSLIHLPNASKINLETVAPTPNQISALLSLTKSMAHKGTILVAFESHNVSM